MATNGMKELGYEYAVISGEATGSKLTMYGTYASNTVYIVVISIRLFGW